LPSVGASIFCALVEPVVITNNNKIIPTRASRINRKPPLLVEQYHTILNADGKPNSAFTEQLEADRRHRYVPRFKQGDEMKTIKDITNNVGQPSAAPSHVYDRQTKKIYTAEDHGHLRAVRKDMAAGQMMIPRVKKV
jgi:hypothetical protein